MYSIDHLSLLYIAFLEVTVEVLIYGISLQIAVASLLIGDSFSAFNCGMQHCPIVVIEMVLNYDVGGCNLSVLIWLGYGVGSWSCRWEISITSIIIWGGDHIIFKTT